MDEPAKQIGVAPNGKPAACAGQHPADAKRYRASRDFLIREVAGETVMVPVGTGPGQFNGMLTVNESFCFLWRQFQTPCTVRQAAAAALEHFDGPEEQVIQDISDFVAESCKAGFLTQEEM